MLQNARTYLFAAITLITAAACVGESAPEEGAGGEGCRTDEGACGMPDEPAGSGGGTTSTSSSSSSSTTDTTSTLSGPGPSGGGGADCPDGLYRCGGVCVDLMTDDDHCGQCDWYCEEDNGIPYYCQSGECLP